MDSPSGVSYSVTIAVVTAFEFEDFRSRHPELFGAGRRVIGYWFWELAIVPADQAPAFAFVDRVWAPSTFVADAYRSSGGAPVDSHRT